MVAKDKADPTHGFFVVRYNGVKFRCEYYHNKVKGYTKAWVEGNKKVCVTAQLDKNCDIWDGVFGYNLVKLRMRKLIIDTYYNILLKQYAKLQTKLAYVNMNKHKTKTDIKNLHDSKYPSTGAK